MPASVPLARHRLDALLDKHELSGHRLGDIRLAFTEAITNAIIHAYPDGKQADDVWVTAVTTTAAFVVTVRDYGAGFRPGESSNGLGVGLQLIHSLADTVTITNSNPGLAVCMTFWLYDKSEAAVC